MDYPLTSKTGKQYRLIEYQGKQAREYESGTILDDETGKMLKPAEGTTITPQNTDIMAEAKRMKRLERARRGLIRGASAYSTEGVYDEWDALEALIEAQTELALTPEAKNASTQAAKFVLDQTDLLIERITFDGKDANGNRLIGSMSDDRIKQLIAAVEQRTGSGG